MKDFGPQTWVLPMPALIVGTYDENGNPDAMTAAWGGVYDTNMITISMSSHKTTENFMKTKALTVAFPGKKDVVEADYVGIVSLNDDPDKMKKVGWHVVKAKHVNAPIFEELGLTLECELVSFIDGTVIAKIVNVTAREDVLGEDGLPDIKKINPISYDPIHHKYIDTGVVVEDAFRAGNKLK